MRLKREGGGAGVTVGEAVRASVEMGASSARPNSASWAEVFPGSKIEVRESRDAISGKPNITAAVIDSFKSSLSDHMPSEIMFGPN